MRREQGVHCNTHDHNFLFSRQMSVLDLPMESPSKHHPSPVYPTLNQQPAVRQSPTQAECRWHINTVKKKHMWGLESFRQFYCRNTCVHVADGSNYGRKTLPCAENRIPIAWAQANDAPWGPVKPDHSEFGRSTSLAWGCDPHCWKHITTWYYLCLVFLWEGMWPQTPSSKMNMLSCHFC